MWQNIIIAVVVLICALYVGRKLLHQARGKDGCGCGCAGCTSPPSADSDPEADEPPAGCGCSEKR